MFGYVFHDTNGQKHGRKLKILWYLLNESLYGHPLAGLLWERQFQQALLELGWEKIQNWGCMFVHRKQDLFLSVYVDDIKMAGKKQNLAPMWKKLMKKRRYWRTYIISWPRVFGMHPEGMQTKWSHHWTLHKKVRITYFCWSNREITGMAKTSRTNRGVVLRHGRTCSEMCWAILWIGKQESRATFQSFSSLVWMIISSKRRNWDQLENCQKFAQMLVLGTNWTTWHLVVREQNGKISHKMGSSMW